MLPDVVEVKPLGEYRLYLRFEDDASGSVDMAALVDFQGVFAPLRDQAFFDQVRVEPDLGTIVWPNGADIDPVVLYSVATGEPLPDFTTVWATSRG